MNSTMKRLILSLTISLCALAASAQIRTAYFMEGSYFRSDMNPALIPDRGYFTVPVISGLGMGINNNFLSVDNFIYSRDGETVTALDSRVGTSEFIDKLPKNGHFDFNANINLFSAGFSTRKMFWSIGANVRANVDMNVGKNLFYAMKNIGNGTYDLSSVSFDGSAYSEIYVGACRPIFDWLRVGARAKGLIGIVNVGADLRKGTFAVTRSEIGADMHGVVRGSGIIINPDYTVGKDAELGTLMADGVRLNNLRSGGIAFDLGAEASLLMDHLKVSIGITDLGFISWSKEAAASADLRYGIDFRGVDFKTGEVNMESTNQITTNAPQGYTRRLNTTINIGVEYNLLNNWIAFGLLSHTEFRQLYTISELTASANFRIGKHFTTTLSHTFCGRNRAGIFGFALNVHTVGANLFLGTDYIDTTYVPAGSMLCPKYQKSFCYYIGLGFNLGENKF